MDREFAFRSGSSTRARAAIAGRAKIFLKNEAVRYDKEKAQIKKKAEALEKETEPDSEINGYCDFGALFLQLAVVVASVSIPSRLRLFWLMSLGVGALGLAIGLSACWI